MLPKTVLIVDDDREIALSLGALLRSWGIRVLSSEDGLAAMQLLQRETVDLVLIDYRLPGGNGVDFYQRLQSNSKFMGLPAIFMSGFPRSEIDPNVGYMSRVGFIPKPVDPKVLREAMESLFGGPDSKPS